MCGESCDILIADETKLTPQCEKCFRTSDKELAAKWHAHNAEQLKKFCAAIRQRQMQNTRRFI
jgi:hypothetical protein